jgi:putative chitinase
VIDQIPEAAAKFGITTNLRLAHFLAQCALESAKFHRNGREPQLQRAASLQVFPNTQERGCECLARNPQKIGSRVYANRMGNGDEASAMVSSIAGRGYIQTHGKNNYQSFTNHIGEDCVANPDLVATKYPACFCRVPSSTLTTSGQFAIKAPANAIVSKVSTRVNGANPAHGLVERPAEFQEVPIRRWG